MKRTKWISFLVAMALCLTLLVPTAFAANTQEDTKAAEALYSLGLFKGTGTNPDGTPIFDLKKQPTRNQALIMLVRLLGKEEAALAGKWDIPFTDVTEGMLPYVGYAYTNGLTKGYTETEYRGTKLTNANQYYTFVLRALGYESGKDFEVTSAGKFAGKLGLTTDSSVGQFTRGNVAAISLKALNTPLADGSSTLAEKLIREGVFTAAQYEAASTAGIAWDGTAAVFPGSGTEADPYRIETPQHLAYLSQQVCAGNSYRGKNFVLKNDLDLKKLEWTPIGDYDHPFNGKFDGGGHTVSNLKITRLNPIYIGDWNEWHNTYSCIGLFASVDGEISNLSVNGEIRIYERGAEDKSSMAVGGIVGMLGGTGRVYRCFSSCEIRLDSDSKEAYLNAGGVVGVYCGYSTIDSCGNLGSISALGTHVVRLGGIAGDSDGSGVIVNCWNRGSVSAEDTGTGIDIGAGGMTCHTYNTKIENCFNLGDIYAAGEAGGILAYQMGDNRDAGNARLANCYSAGTVRGGTTGAICGSAYLGELENCFWLDGQLKAVGLMDSKATLSEVQQAKDPQELLTRLNAWVEKTQSAYLTYSAWKLDSGALYPSLVD